MSVATSSLANPTRTKALMVRLAPYLVEAICELTRALKDKTHAQTEISGLLFGNSQDGLVTVEALKTFKDSSGPRSDLARRERMEKAFTAAMTLANEDPEFSAYKLLGWFSLRGGGGLINSDVEFHNRHFKTAEEVALIVWREGDTQLTTELYAPVEPSKLSAEDYRWSSVRLSTELRHVSQPLDLVMRVRMNDDLYMRTYGVSDGRERKDEWKKIAENAKRTLLSFLPGRKSDVVYPEDLPLPPATGTAKRSFESRTLFRGSDTETSTPEPAQLKAPPAKPPAATTTAPPAPAAPPTPTVPRVTPRVQQQPPPPTADMQETQVAPPAFDFNRAPRPRTTAPEVSGLPMVIPKHKPSRLKDTPWLSMALVFVAFSALTFGFMALRAAGSGDGKLSQVMRVLFPGSDLELRAASHGDSLWISWNRKNPVVSSSTGALLTVSDGPRHFDKKLDPSQVADGEVKYTPVSGDVTFQLRVYGTDQSVLLGSLRVLDATAPVSGEAKPPLDLSANPTPPPESNPANQETTSAPPPAANPADNNTNATPLVRAGEAASNNRVSLPAASAPVAPVHVLTPESKRSAAETARLNTALKAAQQRQPVVQQQQSSSQPAPSQTAQQQPPSATSPNAVKPATHPTTTGPASFGSGTAINGWDPNLPENKPAPQVQQPVRQPATGPPDSKTVDFIPPKVLLQVMPNTRNLTPGSITEVTRVEVEVRIDTSGHVQAAHLTNPNVKSQLGSAAMSAAKQWTFQAATLRGLPVPSDHTIVFEFRPEGQ